MGRNAQILQSSLLKIPLVRSTTSLSLENTLTMFRNAPLCLWSQCSAFTASEPGRQVHITDHPRYRASVVWCHNIATAWQLTFSHGNSITEQTEWIVAAMDCRVQDSHSICSVYVYIQTMHNRSCCWGFHNLKLLALGEKGVCLCECQGYAALERSMSSSRLCLCSGQTSTSSTFTNSIQAHRQNEEDIFNFYVYKELCRLAGKKKIDFYLILSKETIPFYLEPL